MSEANLFSDVICYLTKKIIQKSKIESHLSIKQLDSQNGFFIQFY